MTPVCSASAGRRPAGRSRSTPDERDLVAELLVDLLEVGHLLHARRAPRGEEVHDQRLAGVVGQGRRGAVEAGEGDGRARPCQRGPRSAVGVVEAAGPQAATGAGGRRRRRRSPPRPRRRDQRRPRRRPPASSAGAPMEVTLLGTPERRPSRRGWPGASATRGAGPAHRDAVDRPELAHRCSDPCSTTVSLRAGPRRVPRPGRRTPAGPRVADRRAPEAHTGCCWLARPSGRRATSTAEGRRCSGMGISGSWSSGRGVLGGRPRRRLDCEDPAVQEQLTAPDAPRLTPLDGPLEAGGEHRAGRRRCVWPGRCRGARRRRTARSRPRWGRGKRPGPTSHCGSR